MAQQGPYAALDPDTLLDEHEDSLARGPAEGGVVRPSPDSWAFIDSLDMREGLADGRSTLRAPPAPLFARWNDILGWLGKGMSNPGGEHYDRYWRLFPILPHLLLPALPRSRG